MKDVTIDIADFKKGFYALEDTTKAPFGSLRVMENARVTDRGGLSPRLGTLLLGTASANTNPTNGFYRFKKSFGSDEILMKTYDDEWEGYSKNHTSPGWFRIKDGLTANKEFGFVTSLVNTDNDDFVFGCNRFDDYQRWKGAITQLNGALVGAETDVTVDSVLASDVFESKTATSSTATTLGVAGTPWAASQWVNFYVYITGGALNGKIRLITSNTSSAITFDTLGSDPGDVTFEIRKLIFSPTGSIIYGGTVIAYTGIDTATTIQVASAHAGSDNAIVTQVPDTYPENPRGNRFTNYLNRIVVGRVRSALSRGSGGALQGYSSAGSVFVSKINTPTSFTFTATRVAGEGDIISMPYGGDDISDVAHQEDTAYVFKPRYIEAIKYSQDANDLAVREPLKEGVGSIGKVVKGADDIFFFTADKQFTSIGRVRQKDIKPGTLNIGWKIKRYLEASGIDSTVGRGREIMGKIYYPIKSSSTKSYNDVTLVYNKQTDSFEGIWNVPAFGIEEFNDKYYYAESTRPNVYQLFIGNSDVEDTTRYPINFNAATHFMNFSTSKFTTNAMYCLAIEGYIKGGSQFDFKAWKDFANDPFLSGTFAASETGFLDGDASSAALATGPLGMGALGAEFGDVDSDGRRHFMFRVYFPFQYGNFFSLGVSSFGTDIDFEITRMGIGLKEEPAVSAARIKTL